MKLQEKTMHGYEFLAFKDANIPQVEGLDQLLSSFTKRISISYSRSSMVKTYCRALRDVFLFHGCLPHVLETDQILDYLHFLKEKGLSWTKIKLDAAGLKYFYREMAGDESLASSIPYPKEEKSLPLILSRKELIRLFDAAPNPKHRVVILQLIYGSGLPRNELINLRIRDIETYDGKCRIRINNGKGGKDRYTVLSQKVLPELREYLKACRPKDYLFNGQKKGQPMSHELLRYIMQGTLKRSGIQKPASLHTLRHCRVGGPICLPCTGRRNEYSQPSATFRSLKHSVYHDLPACERCAAAGNILSTGQAWQLSRLLPFSTFLKTTSMS